jgi:hypothetical protein
MSKLTDSVRLERLEADMLLSSLPPAEVTKEGKLMTGYKSFLVIPTNSLVRLLAVLNKTYQWYFIRLCILISNPNNELKSYRTREYLRTTEVADALGISEYTSRIFLKHLQDLNIIKIVKMKPKIYIIIVNPTIVNKSLYFGKSQIEGFKDYNAPLTHKYLPKT